MKKLTALLLILCVTLTLAACGGEPAGPTEPETKTVYLLATQVYDYEGEDITDITIKYDYDEKGNITKITQSEGEQEMVVTCVCDESGKLMSRTMVTGETTIVTKYTYDENGNMTNQTTYTNEEVTQSFAYTYDEQGRQISVTSESRDLERVTTYTYGEHELPIAMSVTQNGVVVQTTTFTLNEEGKHTAAVNAGADGEVATKLEVVYEGSTETRTTTDTQGNVIQTQVRTYDENGNVIQEKVTSHYFSYTCTYTYITMEVPA